MRPLYYLRSRRHSARAKLLVALVIPVLFAASQVVAGPTASVQAATTGTIVQNGPSVTASVTTPGQTSILTFTGKAGETLSLRAAHWTFPADGGTTLQVVDSASHPVGPTGTLNGTGVVTLEPIALPSAGQYSVVVDPSKFSDTGSVQLTLTDIEPITANGAAVTASVGTAGQVGAVSFQATAGELVGVQVSNSTFPSDSLTTMTITDTSGALQSTVVYLNGGSSPFLGPVRLAKAGIYVIVVDPTNGTDVGSAQLTLSTFTDRTGSITPNGPAVTAAVSVPGQQAILTFSATAGQEFGIQANDSTFPSGATAPRFYIADSSGQEVGGDNYIYDPPVVDGPITVPAAGTYQVVVDPGPDSAATGTVSVKLFSFTDQTGPLTPDGPAVTADITAPSQRAIYTFSGTAGQNFVVRYTASTFTLGSDVLNVISPTGANVAQIPVNTPSGTTPRFTLAATGTYQVIVDPTSQGDTGSMSLSLLSVNDTHDTITPGNPVNVSITTPGQRAYYSLTTTTAGQEIGVSIADSTFSSNKDELYVLDANGNGVGDTYFLADGNFGPFTLGPPGTYQIVIDPASYNQNDTGSLTLTLTLTPSAAQADSAHTAPRISARTQLLARRVPDLASTGRSAGKATATSSSGGASVILAATLKDTIITDGCTDSCAGTESHEVQTTTVNWTVSSDNTSTGTVSRSDIDSGDAHGPVCTFPYYSDSAAVSSGTGTNDVSVSYTPDGTSLNTYLINLGAITGTTTTLANSIMAGHCVGIEPPTPARSTTTSSAASILASDHTITGQIADSADQISGQQDCGSGTSVSNDITLIITTTACTITYTLYLHPVQITTPDVQVVNYIPKFTQQSCENQIQPYLASGHRNDAPLACLALTTSANPDPPADLSDPTTFLASKEYRGYVHISPTTVICNQDGTIQSFGSPTTSMSVGFTPIRLFSKTITFSPAEALTREVDRGTWPSVRSGSLSGYSYDQTQVIEPNPSTVLISYIFAARVGLVPRLIAAALTGYDAPFIWEVVQIRASCGGNPGTGVSVVASAVPTTSLYVKGALVTSNPLSNLGPFIQAGDPIPNQIFRQPVSEYVEPPGVGPLAVVSGCSAPMDWTDGSGAPVLGSPADTCADEISDAQTGGPNGGTL